MAAALWHVAAMAYCGNQQRCGGIISMALGGASKPICGSNGNMANEREMAAGESSLGSYLSISRSSMQHQSIFPVINQLTIVSYPLWRIKRIGVYCGI